LTQKLRGFGVAHFSDCLLFFDISVWNCVKTSHLAITRKHILV